MPAPTITLPVTPVPIDVEFNMARLEAIEDATGKTCNDLLLGDFREWVKAGDQTETPEAREKAVRAISVKSARKFLAGVLGCTPKALDGLVPMERAMEVLSASVSGFVRAVVMLNGGRDAAEPAPADAKDGVQPGPTEPAASPA